MLLTAAPRYEPGAWMRGGERFPRGAKLVVFKGGTLRDLVANFSATADAAVSFDGQRVLFAGKRRASDNWQIWEVAASGGEPRSVLACSTDCVRPFYLPQERFAYARKLGGRFQLESAPLNGTGFSVRLSYGPGNFLATDVLHDGRLLFEAAFPLGGSASSELYTVYSDGSGVESYRCDHGASRHSGKQVASGDIVFSVGHGLARFTSSRAQAVNLDVPYGEYDGDLVELSPGSWLLPWRPKATALFNLRRWDTHNNELQDFYSDPHANLVAPVLLAPHPTPNRHPSALHKWSYANLLCLNAHITKENFAPGSITAMKLYQIDAVGKPQILGASPVLPDGSFFVQVSADRPLQIELLDAAGHTIHRQKGWFWMRAGEQRICVGCHAGPEHAPENSVPEALRGSAEPVNLTGAPLSAHSAGAALEPK